MFNLKKILVGALVVGITGVLIFGAIYRTQAKTVENSSSTQTYTRNSEQHDPLQTSGRGRNQTSTDHLISTERNLLNSRDNNQASNWNQSTLRSETNLDYRQEGNQGSSSSGNGNRQGQQSGTSGSSTARGNEQNLAEEQINEIVNLQGTILSINEEEMTLQTIDGNEILVEGRALSFAYEQNFQANIQDKLALRGFFEDDDFEIITIENLTSGQTITLREESGRPLWAGGAGRN